jgi:hypothetical protein
MRLADTPYNPIAVGWRLPVCGSTSEAPPSSRATQFNLDHQRAGDTAPTIVRIHDDSSTPSARHRRQAIPSKPRMTCTGMPSPHRSRAPYGFNVDGSTARLRDQQVFTAGGSR